MSINLVLLSATVLFLLIVIAFTVQRIGVTVLQIEALLERIEKKLR